MKTAETDHPADNPRKCPKCDTELREAVLNGQCPVCLVKVMRESDAGEAAALSDSPSLQPAISHQPSAIESGNFRYFGDYELLAEIGHGGMGVVYRARQLSLNRTVALKLIAPAQLTSPKAIERFHTEAEAAASLDHPNIVPIYETGDCEGRHYFSMKLIEGQSLAQRISDFQLTMDESQDRQERIALSRSQIVNRKLSIVSLVAKVASAVHYAHQRGILHRDLKPGNILIDASGEPHVTDFGLARNVEEDSSLTLSGEVIGTPAYMAPEQAAGKARQITTAADVYGLGVILYELLTGRPPFRGETAVETLHAVVHDDPPRPRSLNVSVPRDLETICLKCLEKEPAKRYASAQELADELRRFERGEPIQARAISPPEKVWRWCRRKPALAGALASFAVALLLGIGGVLWQWRRAQQNAVEARASELTARENLYAADIHSAHQALAADNFRQALDLLQKQIPKPGEPDLRGFEWRYLWRQCQSDELFSLPGHKQTAGTLAFSPDGKMLATGSKDKTVKIWDLDSRREIATLAEQTNEIESVCVSPRGDLLATGSKTALRVWDAKTLQPLHAVPQPAVTVRFSPDGQYLAAGGTNLVLWDTHTWEPVKTIELPSLKEGWLDGNSFGLAFSPNSRRIAVVLKDGVRLLTVPDLQERELLKDRMPRVMFVAFGPDGRTLATCTLGHDIKLWDVEGAKELRVLSGHSDTVNRAGFSPDGKRLATASYDQTVKLWDVANGTLLRTFRGHAEEVWDVAFSPNGKLLASASKDGAVKLWDALAEPKQAARLHDFVPVGFDPVGDLVAIKKAQVLVFDPATLQKVSALVVFNGRIGSRRWGTLGNLADDGRTISLPSAPMGSSAGVEVEVWDLQRRRFVCSVSNSWMKVAFAPKRQLLATGTGPTVTLWKLPQGQRQCVLTNSIGPIGFSADERLLATLDNHEGSGFKIWSLEENNRAITAKLSTRIDGGMPAALSPDGRMLATGGSGGFVRLFAARSGLETATLIGHKRDTTAMSFSPDGRTLATISDDATVRLWHVKTRRELLSFPFPIAEGPVLRPEVKFAADGRTLVAHFLSNGDTQMTDVWHAPSLDEIAVTEGGPLPAAPDPKSRLLRGRALVKRGGSQEALQVFSEVIQQCAGRPELEAVKNRALEHRSQVLTKFGRLAEAGADNCAMFEIPARAPVTPRELIDLSCYFNRPLDRERLSIPPILDHLQALPHGVHTLPGTGAVQFDLRGAVQLREFSTNQYASFTPASADGIPIRQNCQRLHFLQSADFRESEGAMVGAYVIHYADGQREEIPIRYGEHVRDCLLSEDPDDPRQAKVAWTGAWTWIADTRQESTFTIRLFEQTWENPRPEVEIQSLDFVSKITKSRPFLIAITAEP